MSPAATAARRLSMTRDGMMAIGYQQDLVRENYEFADVLDPSGEPRRIGLVAFGQEPASYRTACLGAVVMDSDWAQAPRQYRALGAPQILALHPRHVRRWKILGEGEPELLGEFVLDELPRVLRTHQDDWGPDSVLRAKAIPLDLPGPQLDFVDAGLLPALETEVRDKLHSLLTRTMSDTRRSYVERHAEQPDFERLCRLVFRLLAGKLLADRGQPGDWTSSNPAAVIAAIENFYFRSEAAGPGPVLDDLDVQRVAWDVLRSGFHRQNISVSALAYVYENTLVDKDVRRKLSIHSTPPEIAEYIVRRLPIEDLAREERRIFEPFPLCQDSMRHGEPLND